MMADDAIMPLVIKTQIQLEEWQYRTLKGRSAATSRSMSDLIREAVTLSLKRQDMVRPIAEIAGRFAPDPEPGLKPHDASWAESIR